MSNIINHPIQKNVLETERITLKPLSYFQAHEIASWHSEQKSHISPWLPDQPPTYFETTFWRQKIMNDRREWNQDIAYRFMVQKEDEIIGKLSFFSIKRDKFPQCTITYTIASEFQGQGFMSEAVKAGMIFGSKLLKIKTFKALVHPNNLRSQKLLERLDFRFEKVEKKALLIEGQYVDHLMYQNIIS